MTWYVKAIGRPLAAAKAVREDLERQTCRGPEEAIKTSIANIIDAACAAMPAGSAVEIEAAGSQVAHTEKDPKVPATQFSNYVKLEIKPIYHFAE